MLQLPLFNVAHNCSPLCSRCVWSDHPSWLSLNLTHLRTVKAALEYIIRNVEVREDIAIVNGN